MLEQQLHLENLVHLKKSEQNYLKMMQKQEQDLLQLKRELKKFIQAKKLGRVLADGTVEIPVVNLLYRTTAENLSDARIMQNKLLFLIKTLGN